jgi:hypothetical protein
MQPDTWLRPLGGVDPIVAAGQIIGSKQIIVSHHENITKALAVLVLLRVVCVITFLH